jgi:hypothetical protein
MHQQSFTPLKRTTTDPMPLTSYRVPDRGRAPPPSAGSLYSGPLGLLPASSNAPQHILHASHLLSVVAVCLTVAPPLPLQTQDLCTAAHLAAVRQAQTRPPLPCWSSRQGGALASSRACRGAECRLGSPSLAGRWGGATSRRAGCATAAATTCEGHTDGKRGKKRVVNAAGLRCRMCVQTRATATGDDRFR